MQVLSLNTATARTLDIDGRGVLSAIHKRSREGAVALRPLGLEGDEQADLSVHGGLSKAVYAYPSEHYAFWQTVRGQARASGHEAPLPFGALGENLTLAGLLEQEVWIGDVLKFPDAELVVSEPRFPCFKLNAALGFKHAVKMMVQSAWCGFYLAVRTPGSLAAGQRFELQPGPREVGVQEIFRAKARA
ncbi:MAG: MOSC domain-containing protein [Burkholderiaceae bacterium]|nr:MOSC domain-containing protein [Roseateles sp.]MBV8470199.1 MOSC domain-containing protein [Burkholderiaceae bacterium]